MRSLVLSRIVLFISIVLPQTGLPRLLNDVFRLSSWVEYIWTAIIMLLGVELSGYLTPNFVYPYGHISLGMSLKGKKKAGYLIVVVLSFLAFILVIRATFYLNMLIKLAGLILGVLILYLIPLHLYGTAEMMSFSRR